MDATKHRFYVPPDLITTDRVVFSKDEARHAVKVLRLGTGHVVTVVDGVGGTLTAELETVSAKGIVARIVARTENEGEPGCYVHAAVGLLKQASRWETFLEKAVELGVSRITPLVTSRMQKEAFNRRRAEAILIAALKQSGRSRLPALDDPTRFSHVLEQTKDLECRIICHEASYRAGRLHSLLSSVPSRVGLMVGPEGGFSDEEVYEAGAAGWNEVWLGSRKLRTETAAMTALAYVTQYLDERAAK